MRWFRYRIAQPFKLNISAIIRKIINFRIISLCYCTTFPRTFCWNLPVFCVWPYDTFGIWWPNLTCVNRNIRLTYNRTYRGTLTVQIESKKNANSGTFEPASRSGGFNKHLYNGTHCGPIELFIPKPKSIHIPREPTFTGGMSHHPSTVPVA